MPNQATVLAAKVAGALVHPMTSATTYGALGDDRAGVVAVASISTILASQLALGLLVSEVIADRACGTELGKMTGASTELALRVFIAATR